MGRRQVRRRSRRDGCSGFDLNSFQELRALRDGVVVGKNNLGIDAETCGRLLCRRGLFKLVIVFPSHQGNEQTYPFHHTTLRGGNVACWVEDSAPGEGATKHFNDVLYRETSAS